MGYFKNVDMRNKEEGNLTSSFLGSTTKPCALLTFYNLNSEAKSIIIYEDSEINIKYVKQTNNGFKLKERNCRISKLDWTIGITTGPMLKGIYIDISKKHNNNIEYVEIENIRDLNY